MKLNNKGFAISTILYGLLALLIMILMLTFEIMRTSNNNSKDLSEKINELLNGSSGECRTARIELKKCVGGTNTGEPCESVKNNFEDKCLKD